MTSFKQKMTGGLIGATMAFGAAQNAYGVETINDNSATANPEQTVINDVRGGNVTSEGGFASQGQEQSLQNDNNLVGGTQNTTFNEARDRAITGHVGGAHAGTLVQNVTCSDGKSVNLGGVLAFNFGKTTIDGCEKKYTEQLNKRDTHRTENDKDFNAHATALTLVVNTQAEAFEEGDYEKGCKIAQNGDKKYDLGFMDDIECSENNADSSASVTPLSQGIQVQETSVAAPVHAPAPGA